MLHPWVLKVQTRVVSRVDAGNARKFALQSMVKPYCTVILLYSVGVTLPMNYLECICFENALQHRECPLWFSFRKQRAVFSRKVNIPPDFWSCACRA
jgi:hypothetical protein